MKIATVLGIIALIYASVITDDMIKDEQSRKDRLLSSFCYAEDYMPNVCANVDLD